MRRSRCRELDDHEMERANAHRCARARGESKERWQEICAIVVTTSIITVIITVIITIIRRTRLNHPLHAQVTIAAVEAANTQNHAIIK